MEDSGMATTSEFSVGLAQKFCAMWAAQGGTPEQLNSLAESAKRIREILGNVAYTVTVNYDRTVEEMLEAGQYDWSNDNITADNFPLPNGKAGAEIIEVELIHFDRYISSEDAIAEMAKRGLRPATLAELLALGEQYPDLQREFPIVALGTVWRGRGGGRYVPYLYGGGQYRSLDLHWFEDDWDDDCRFAAVRA